MFFKSSVVYFLFLTFVTLLFHVYFYMFLQVDRHKYTHSANKTGKLLLRPYNQQKITGLGLEGPFYFVRSEDSYKVDEDLRSQVCIPL